MGNSNTKTPTNNKKTFQSRDPVKVSGIGTPNCLDFIKLINHISNYGAVTAFVSPSSCIVK